MTGIVCSMVGASYAPPVVPITYPGGVQFQRASSERITYSSIGNKPGDVKVWTTSFWFKPTTFTSGQKYAVGSVISPAASNNAPWYPHFNGNTLHIYAHYVNGFTDLTYTNSWTSGQWYHVVGKVNGTNSGRQQIWVDGVRVLDQAAFNMSSGSYHFSDISSLNIGSILNAYDHFDGCLNQVYMYAGDIDLDTDISKFYNNGYVDFGTSGTSSGLPSPHVYHYGTTQSDFATRRGSITGTVSVNGTLSNCS